MNEYYCTVGLLLVNVAHNIVSSTSAHICPLVLQARSRAKAAFTKVKVRTNLSAT